MHAASIKFDHAFFVGMSAKADAFIVRIVLWPLNDLERGLQGVAAACQVRVGIVEVVVAVSGRNQDGQFDWLAVFALWLRSGVDRTAKSKRSGNSRGDKFSTGTGHGTPRLRFQKNEELYHEIGRAHV